MPRSLHTEFPFHLWNEIPLDRTIRALMAERARTARVFSSPKTHLARASRKRNTKSSAGARTHRCSRKHAQHAHTILQLSPPVVGFRLQSLCCGIDSALWCSIIVTANQIAAPLEKTKHKSNNTNPVCAWGEAYTQTLINTHTHTPTVGLLQKQCLDLHPHPPSCFRCIHCRFWPTLLLFSICRCSSIPAFPLLPSFAFHHFCFSSSLNAEEDYYSKVFVGMKFLWK